MVKFTFSFFMLCALIFLTPWLYANDDFLVAIDIGHTPKKYGALSARGVAEYQFNKDIAKILSNKIDLEDGISSFVINASGEEISLQERTKAAYKKNADIFISLHHDSVQEKHLKPWIYREETHYYSDNFTGYSIFVSLENIESGKSYRLANILGEKLRSQGFVPTLHHAEKIEGENRELLNAYLGVYRFDDLIVLKSARMPAILLECGIIVNRRDEILLGSRKFKEKFSAQVVKSILAYKSDQVKNSD